MTNGEAERSIGVTFVHVVMIGSPSKSALLFASELTKRKPFAAEVEAKGESAPTGITLGSVENSQPAGLEPSIETVQVRASEKSFSQRSAPLI